MTNSLSSRCVDTPNNVPPAAADDDEAIVDIKNETSSSIDLELLHPLPPPMSLPPPAAASSDIVRPLDLEAQEEEKRTCRICLEEDNDDDRSSMIAPCLCKGSSKWVHRHCLDQWRTNQNDENHIAFSKCMECKFQYHMEIVMPMGGPNNQKHQQRHERHRLSRRRIGGHLHPQGNGETTQLCKGTGRGSEQSQK